MHFIKKIVGLTTQHSGFPAMHILGKAHSLLTIRDNKVKIEFFNQAVCSCH